MTKIGQKRHRKHKEIYSRQAVPVSVSQKGPIFAIMSRLNNVKIVLKYCQPWKTAYNK